MQNNKLPDFDGFAVKMARRVATLDSSAEGPVGTIWTSVWGELISMILRTGPKTVAGHRKELIYGFVT